MHILQPKQTILKKEETEKLLEKFDISLSQLPKIKVTDSSLPENVNIGDVVKVQRKDEEGEQTFYRVVIV